MCNNIGYYFYIIDSIKYSMKNTIWKYNTMW